MNFRLIAILTAVFCLQISQRAFSQYILNGSAEQNSCNCYTLTRPVQTQSGGVWNSVKIDLNKPFDFWFNVFLGCSDAGADGIVFMLQPISTSVGSTGEGMGFAGVSPSIGIALDTYYNNNQHDPSYDHISIQKNGIVDHNSDLAGPVPISAISDDVEDCKWHRLRIAWDPTTQWIRAYFDGVLRVETQLDIINRIFIGDPMVYWGFTGATGGQINLQQFCTALDPDFLTNFPLNAACAPATMQFFNQSESFAPIVSYDWDFGDGSKATGINPPAHTYQSSGAYNVTLKIKGLDGCENDTVKTVKIGGLPAVIMSISDTCFNKKPTLSLSQPPYGVSYQWQLDGAATSDLPAALANLPVGIHNMQVVANSDYNCGIAARASSIFVIKPLPSVDVSFSQLCKTINFSGRQTDALTSVNHWSWDFGDNQQSALQNPSHIYVQSKQYKVILQASADNGCESDTATKIIDIPTATVFAGNDTIAIPNLPFQLKGAGNGKFLWSPSIGLSNPDISNPVLILTSDMTYTLTVTTAEGCVATDTIHLKAIVGPAIYVPTAFTPNGDRLNDILRPVYVGIKQLDRFSVFDRWGKTVFSTSDMSKGWDGRVSGMSQASSTYVWIIRAWNYLDQPVDMRGTVTVIR